MNTKGYSALVQKRWDHTCMKYLKSLNLLSLQQTTAMAFSNAQMDFFCQFTTQKHILTLA